MLIVRGLGFLAFCSRSGRSSLASFMPKNPPVLSTAPPAGWRQSPVSAGRHRMFRTAMPPPANTPGRGRSEEHTSELQSPCNLVCRLLLEKKKKKKTDNVHQYNYDNES